MLAGPQLARLEASQRFVWAMSNMIPRSDSNCSVCHFRFFDMDSSDGALGSAYAGDGVMNAHLRRAELPRSGSSWGIQRGLRAHAQDL
jgi:hypothetical protein